MCRCNQSYHTMSTMNQSQLKESTRHQRHLKLHIWREILSQSQSALRQTTAFFVFYNNPQTLQESTILCMFLFHLLSVATVRRIFNLFASSHASPASTNTSNKADDRRIVVLNIELSLSNNPVDLSTARGIVDSWGCNAMHSMK